MSWIGPAIGAVSGILSSGRRGSASATQENAPWAQQQPYLLDLFKNAQSLYQGGGLANVAGFNMADLYGQNYLMNLATGAGPAATGQLVNSWVDALNATNVNANPNLAAYIQAGLRPLQQQFSEQVIPSIQGGALGAGQYGGSRQGIAEGIASRGLTDASQSLISNILNNAYNTGVSARGQAIGQAPNVFASLAAPAGYAGTVGSQIRGQEQAQLDQPYNALERYKSLVGQPVGSSSASTSTGVRVPALNATLGGALLGQYAQNQFFPQTALQQNLSGNVFAGL